MPGREQRGSAGRKHVWLPAGFLEIVGDEGRDVAVVFDDENVGHLDKPAEGSALEIPAEPLTGLTVSLWRASRAWTAMRFGRNGAQTPVTTA